MDKHELRLQVSPPGVVDHALLSIAHLLQAQELIALSPETNTFAITREGRRFIGRLLAETESYIDLYDHFKDTASEEGADMVEFDTGRGADLRVLVFIAEGLDPIRTLFLLRLRRDPRCLRVNLARTNQRRKFLCRNSRTRGKPARRRRAAVGAYRRRWFLVSRGEARRGPRISKPGRDYPERKGRVLVLGQANCGLLAGCDSLSLLRK
jgi:hypothetical protein